MDESYLWTWQVLTPGKFHQSNCGRRKIIIHHIEWPQIIMIIVGFAIVYLCRVFATLLSSTYLELDSIQAI